MHSARSDAPPGRLEAFRDLLKRLNVRLVLMLVSVALVALLVSSVALSQILPGYLDDVARRQARTAAIGTALLVAKQAEGIRSSNPGILITEELRNTQLLQPMAEAAANRIAEGAANQLVQGTVEILYDNGHRAAIAAPNTLTDQALRAQGLEPDPRIQARVHDTLEIAPGQRIGLYYVVSDVYTSRATTLERVNGTLVAAGLAALAVALFIGTLAARRLTGPLLRLRRASNRFAQGDLEERAPHFGILEVDELGQQFNLMADQVSESVRMLQADRDRLREFVADVSHELRTPIAALRTFTELQRDGQLKEGERQEFLDRSTQQINRLEWMSTNLLDLSRIDSGIFPMDVRTGDLRDPVRSAVEAHAEIAEARGISLSSRVPTSAVMLRFDTERILQLLSNLIGNALKFTPRGGEVVVELSEVPDHAVLEVRDSGPGIPEGELPHVFDRFFRGTNVGEARASGSGLGLAIARSIVEMHDGTIEVTSALGRGTTFTITLPREERERS